MLFQPLRGAGNRTGVDPATGRANYQPLSEPRRKPPDPARLRTSSALEVLLDIEMLRRGRVFAVSSTPTSCAWCIACEVGPAGTTASRWPRQPTLTSGETSTRIWTTSRFICSSESRLADRGPDYKGKVALVFECCSTFHPIVVTYWYIIRTPLQEKDKEFSSYTPQTNTSSCEMKLRFLRNSLIYG